MGIVSLAPIYTGAPTALSRWGLVACTPFPMLLCGCWSPNTHRNPLATVGASTGLGRHALAWHPSLGGRTPPEAFTKQRSDSSMLIIPLSF